MRANSLLSSVRASVLAGALAICQPAAAVIIVSGPAPDVSNAVQAQNSMLTVQNNGAAETACVLWNEIAAADAFAPCPTGFPGGDETVSSSTTFTAGELSIVDAADLRLTFDAVESAGNGITIDRLMLLFWINPGTFAPPFTVELAGPVVLGSTLNGNGKAEIIFRLDQTSIDALTAAGFNTNTIIGMAVNMSQISSGPESFYLSNTVTAGDVPEPGTYALVAGGLALLCFNNRRRTASWRRLPKTDDSPAPLVPSSPADHRAHLGRRSAG